MKSKLVSVVIPTYSRPTMLEKAIDSVLNQSYKNIEIIVVDDNNPDTKERIETEKLISKYKDNKRIKYIKHKENKNGSAARNTGWKESKGYYITFLDDDDLIKKNKIEKMVNTMENLDESWGMCYSAYELVKQNGYKEISTENRSGFCYIPALMRNLFIGSGSNLFLRKSVVDELNGYDESFKRNQDIEFLARATEKYKIAFIDDVLLSIFQDGTRKKRKYEDIEKIDLYYIYKFESRINKLPKKEKEMVKSVISLDRFRYALMYGKIVKGFKILLENKVKFKYFIKYIIYLINRFISHKSYGFNPNK